METEEDGACAGVEGDAEEEVVEGLEMHHEIVTRRRKVASSIERSNTSILQVCKACSDFWAAFSISSTSVAAGLNSSRR